MGLFRLILAFLICAMHAKAQGMLPASFLPDLRGLELDPKMALFFMMAGMFARHALQMQRGQGLAGVMRFYADRCLRLWPAYWVCAIITFACIKLYDMPITHHRLMPDRSVVEFFLYNALPFTPDILQVGQLPDAWEVVILVFVVLQAWTLALIVAMTLLAPLVLSPSIMRYVFVISWIGVYHAYRLGEFQGYLINSLPYFVAGGYAPDVYRRWLKGHEAATTLRVGAFAGAALLVMVFANYRALETMLGQLPAFFASATAGWCLLPVLYSLTRGARWDRLCSDLAYTLYLSHFLAFFTLQRTSLEDATVYWLVLPLCLLFSVVLHWLVERPLRSLRHRIRRV